MIDTSTDAWTTEPASAREGLPPTVRQLLARANAAWDRDDFRSALADSLEVLDQHPDFPDVRNRVGLCRAMLGDLEGALEAFDHAVRLNPGYAEAFLNRAVILNELSRFDEAQSAFQQAHRLDFRPGDPYPSDLGNRLAIGHAKLADLYIQADQAEAAVEQYRRALELRPAFVDIRSRLARAHMMLDQPEQAVQELTVALEGHPSFLAARLALGAALRRMERTEEAVSEWRRCLEIDPANRRARAYLASAGVRVEEVSVPEREATGHGGVRG